MAVVMAGQPAAETCIHGAQTHGHVHMIAGAYLESLHGLCNDGVWYVTNKKWACATKRPLMLWCSPDEYLTSRGDRKLHPIIRLHVRMALDLMGR